MTETKLKSTTTQSPRDGDDLSGVFSELIQINSRGVEDDMVDHYVDRELPVIDISTLHFDSEEGLSEKLILEREEICRRIAKASETWGFFQVINHGIDPTLIKRMGQITKDFHKLPVEEKMKYRATGIQGGYSSLAIKLEDIRVTQCADFIYHILLPSSTRTPESFFPQNPAAYRSTQTEYSEEILKLTHRLLAALALGLGLRKDIINEKFGGKIGEPRQTMRSNFYLPSEHPESLGLDAHSDPGGITVLLQNDVPGLEVRPFQKWVKVQPIPDALVINIGDQLEILSNGVYKSCLHRGVPHPTAERTSVAVFHGPNDKATIGPLEELVDSMKPTRYPTQTYEEYFKQFVRRGYDGKNQVQSLHATDECSSTLGSKVG